MADKLAVVVATRGRPALLGGLLRRLDAQTRPPDQVIVVATDAGDVRGLEPASGRTILLAPGGLAAQRNAALDHVGRRFDTLAFFDDDFVPSRFWLEGCATLFARRPALAALTGTVLADGIRSAGIAPDEAEAMVDRRDAEPGAGEAVHTGIGPYGCNMAFRASRIAGLRFDARLPLYAWLEDSDFGAQVARRGTVARAEALWGVHLGHKSGRMPGIRLGYSQIANPVYLSRKGTLSPLFSARLMTGNILANALRSVRPEPSIDRVGRLRGNLIALADLARGRVTPERAASL